MIHPDRANLERVVLGPEYPDPEVGWPVAPVPFCVHRWHRGWQKSGPSYRWTATQQWPDDVPARRCLRCGTIEPIERPRSAAIFPWTLAMAIIIVFVLLVVAAASRREPDAPAPSQALVGAPLDVSLFPAGNVATELPSGTPPNDRYRGTATWYCLSGSSACTRGYAGSDLVAAIDSDLGFARGDQIIVRYRDRAVTVTIVDVCGCPGERLIDLTSGAFRRLAPLDAGVIPVTLEFAGPSPTLPPTEALP